MFNQSSQGSDSGRITLSPSLWQKVIDKGVLSFNYWSCLTVESLFIYKKLITGYHLEIILIEEHFCQLIPPVKILCMTKLGNVQTTFFDLVNSRTCRENRIHLSLKHKICSTLLCFLCSLICKYKFLLDKNVPWALFFQLVKP